MKTSPTQRTLKLLRSEGWLCAVVERWNQYAKVRQDLWGFVDILAIKGDIMLAVQTTTGDNVAARFEKLRKLEAVSLWLQSPNRLIEVHGWRKIGKRGERKLWDCRRVPCTLSFIMSHE